jgi:hypothetical protein
MGYLGWVKKITHQPCGLSTQVMITTFVKFHLRAHYILTMVSVY